MAADEKLSKYEVNYGHGKPQAHCSICRHFEPPAACAIVRGTIRPEDWCERFERKAQE